MKTLQYREAERLWVDEELVKDDDVTAFGQMLSGPSASVGVWGESDDGDSHGAGAQIYAMMRAAVVLAHLPVHGVFWSGTY